MVNEEEFNTLPEEKREIVRRNVDANNADVKRCGPTPHRPGCGRAINPRPGDEAHTLQCSKRVEDELASDGDNRLNRLLGEVC